MPFSALICPPGWLGAIHSTLQELSIDDCGTFACGSALQSMTDLKYL